MPTVRPEAVRQPVLVASASHVFRLRFQDTTTSRMSSNPWNSAVGILVLRKILLKRSRSDRTDGGRWRLTPAKAD